MLFAHGRRWHVDVVGDVDADDDEYGVLEVHFRNLRNKMTLYVKAWVFLSCIVVRRSPPKKCAFKKKSRSREGFARPL